MRQIRSFVVRVYRHDEKGVWGVVQDVENGCTHSFHSADQLWTVISVPAAKPATEETRK